MRHRYRNIDPLSRALGYVANTDEKGCWSWVGGKDHKGYGSFQLRAKRAVRAHRFIYEQLIGPIAEGLQLDHLCRNRACCNPAHLEPVTLQENVSRGLTGKVNHMNAVKTHCPRGHAYSVENTYVRPGGGTRCCKACRRKVNQI